MQHDASSDSSFVLNIKLTNKTNSHLLAFIFSISVLTAMQNVIQRDASFDLSSGWHRQRKQIVFSSISSGVCRERKCLATVS